MSPDAKGRVGAGFLKIRNTQFPLSGFCDVLPDDLKGSSRARLQSVAPRPEALNRKPQHHEPQNPKPSAMNPNTGDALLV